MMGIQDYDCPQESVLIDSHEGYVLSDRKKTRKLKIAQFINLLLIGLGRPLADIFCKVITHPGPILNRLAVLHWWRPTNIGKSGPAIFWLFLQNSFHKDCYSFLLNCYSISIVLLLNPQPTWLFLQTLSAKLFPQNSFRKLLETKSGNSGAPF